MAIPTEAPVQPDPVPPRTEPTIGIPKTSTVEQPREQMTVLELTERLKKILPRKDVTQLFKTYKNVVKGKHIVQALAKEFGLTDEQAIAFGQDLQNAHILDHVSEDYDFDSNDKLYRLQCDHTPHILNTYRVWTDRVDPNSLALMKRLKKMLGRIEAAVTNPKTARVDYKAAMTHKDMPEFEEAVCELQGVDYENMGYDRKLAFSINVYNLMIKYAFMKLGIPTSTSARGSFFNDVSFQIGPDVFSFSEFEHGVLRGNRRAPYTLTAQFGSKDPRRRLIMTKVDPRIHFALNCGANGCPPVKDFTEEALEEELRIVAMAFCEGDEQVLVNESSHSVSLSSIFKWYQEDFAESSSGLPKAILPFLRGVKQEKLKRMLHKLGGGPKVKFLTYDWSTNASDHLIYGSDAGFLQQLGFGSTPTVPTQ